MSLVGFADLAPLRAIETIPTGVLDPFTRAVSIALRVPAAVFETCVERPTPLYAAAYQTANRLLDEIAFRTAGLLQDRGYRGLKPARNPDNYCRTTWAVFQSQLAEPRSASFVGVSDTSDRRRRAWPGRDPNGTVRIEEEIMKRMLVVPAVLLALALTGPPPAHASTETEKPSPADALQMLKDGNARFVAAAAKNPHSDAERCALAGRSNQGDFAFATVLSCSDSRVPVERIFDAGVMDLFVIRIAGNVADVDEAGSIEYGLAHVNTPVLVVLGHTQCGAVTAVTAEVEGHGHALERNIPPLVDNIAPAVKRAQAAHPGVSGKDLVPFGIEENVWQSVEDLFMASPATRDLVKAGKVQVVGAIYDVGTGKVAWLPEAKVGEILAAVEASPKKAVEAMAGATGHEPHH